MKNDKHTTEYLKKTLEDVRLSDASRARMREKLSEYADFHAIEGARVSGEDRSREYVQQRTAWTGLFVQRHTQRMYFKASLLIALLVGGGGTAAAAQGTVPGDALYPVKIHVNENVRSALALGANAEARLQTELLKERVEEARELAAEGRLEGEAAADVEARIGAQALAVQKANAEADAEVRTSLRGELATALGDTTAGAETMMMARVADTDDSAEEADSSSTLSATINSALQVATESSATTNTATMLAGESNVDTRLESAAERAESLRATIESEAKIAAEARADFMADLEAAEEHLADARASLAADVRAAAEASIEAAEELLSDIEATLSTMGEIKIDAETGAIIDFNLRSSNSGSVEADGSGATSVGGGATSESGIDLGI